MLLLSVADLEGRRIYCYGRNLNEETWGEASEFRFAFKHEPSRSCFYTCMYMYYFFPPPWLIFTALNIYMLTAIHCWKRNRGRRRWGRGIFKKVLTGLSTFDLHTDIQSWDLWHIGRFGLSPQKFTVSWRLRVVDLYWSRYDLTRQSCITRWIFNSNTWFYHRFYDHEWNIEMKPKKWSFFVVDLIYCPI